MSVNRRDFLTKAGFSVAGAIAASDARPRPALASAVHANDLGSWAAVREQFDQLSRDHIHVSSFFLVSHPRMVRDAIESHRRAIEDNPLPYIEHNMFSMPGRIQTAAAEYLGGRPEEVALVNSTTMGLALVYHGLPLKAGHEVVTTTHDHFVHHESIRLATERAGAAMRKIAVYDGVDTISDGDIVNRLRKAIAPETRVVGVTWVHSGSGVKLPIRAIADMVAEANTRRAAGDRVLLVVDGVHGLGVEDAAVGGLGADFFIAGTHKWMFGPRGTGIVWAKADDWRMLRMVFPAFAPEPFVAWTTETPLAAPMRAAWMTQGGFHAFEYEWALPAAFDLHKQIGRARIAERIHALNEQCKEGLARMPRVRLRTPRGSHLSAGLICFDIDGKKPEDAVARLLEKRVVASASPYSNNCVRLAPSLLNSPEEIETTLRHVRELA